MCSRGANSGCISMDARHCHCWAFIDVSINCHIKLNVWSSRVNTASSLSGRFGLCVCVSGPYLGWRSFFSKWMKHIFFNVMDVGSYAPFRFSIVIGNVVAEDMNYVWNKCNRFKHMLFKMVCIILLFFV